MDRRGFLRGVFGGLAAGGVIVAAKPEEIEAFASPMAREQPLALHQVAPVTPTAPLVSAGQELYNADGELVAIVRSIQVKHQMHDASGWDDASVQMVPGLATIDIQAVGVPSALDWMRRW